MPDTVRAKWPGQPMAEIQLVAIIEVVVLRGAQLLCTYVCIIYTYVQFYRLERELISDVHH